MKTATYNLASIMNRAWAIRKSAAAEMGCKVSEVIWGECLRMAWAEAYAEIDMANAAINAVSVIREWDELGEAGQVKMMTTCVRKAAKSAGGFCGVAGAGRPERRGLAQICFSKWLAWRACKRIKELWRAATERGESVVWNHGFHQVGENPWMLERDRHGGWAGICPSPPFSVSGKYFSERLANEDCRL